MSWDSLRRDCRAYKPTGSATVHRKVAVLQAKPPFSNPFVSYETKNMWGDVKHLPTYFWPARRDSNPRSSESESAALSSCATGGYKPSYEGWFFILRLITVGIVFLPAPGIFTHFVDTALCRPPKQSFCL